MIGVEPTTVWSEVQRDNHSVITVVNCSEFLGFQTKYTGPKF